MILHLTQVGAIWKLAQKVKQGNKHHMLGFMFSISNSLKQVICDFLVPLSSKNTVTESS